jgi:hypothetical protein
VHVEGHVAKVELLASDERVSEVFDRHQVASLLQVAGAQRPRRLPEFPGDRGEPVALVPRG